MQQTPGQEEVQGTKLTSSENKGQEEPRFKGWWLIFPLPTNSSNTEQGLPPRVAFVHLHWFHLALFAPHEMRWSGVTYPGSVDTAMSSESTTMYDFDFGFA